MPGLACLPGGHAGGVPRPPARAQHAGEEQTAAFLPAHPDVAAAGEVVATVGAPLRSWATVRFNSLNTFVLVGPDGSRQPVRFTLVPMAGEQALSEEERLTADRDHLMSSVGTALPIRYRLTAQLAVPDDRTHDPSRAWPADREWADLGEVALTALDDSREQDGDVLVHDPMRLVEGVEPSDDPILRIRSYVYAESVRPRSGLACPAHLR